MWRSSVDASMITTTPPNHTDINRARTTLHRQAFTTSRLMEYFTEKELVFQTGHDREQWPEVALKELVDNALDAAEDSDISPEITVAIQGDVLTVADNGPGIEPEVVNRILDFSSKTSSKDFYVSPTRGAQGNALKTLLAMPYVLSGGASGRIEISSRHVRHVITVAADRIRQEPVLTHERRTSNVKNGTIVRICWSDLARSEDGDRESNFLQRLWGYAVLNPHASFELRSDNKVRWRGGATVAEWQKWCPNDPTSPHWYDANQLRSLIAAYIAAERANGAPRFVRDFVAEFRGLSGTAKQKAILSELDLSGTRLAELVKNRDVDLDVTARLLEAMQRESRAVKPQALGVIGEEHIRQKLEGAGCNTNSIRYRRVTGVDSCQRPYVIETAFGVFERSDDAKPQRRLLCGLNFSPAIGNPFRKLDDWNSLDDVLGEQFVRDDSPTFTLVHLATPSLKYTDRGKSAIDLTALIGIAIKDAVIWVSKDWARIQRQEIRDRQAAERARERMLRACYRERSIKDIVWENMAEVYAKVSGNGLLPAGARQLMYAMRPIVLAELPEKNFSDQYFTQDLLPTFMQENPELTTNWDVVFDARGHFVEPHTNRTIGLGTVAVRNYLSSHFSERGDLSPQFMDAEFDTSGPANRFCNVLFIEKEGFLPLLESAHIAERFDLAIMSTKGMSSTAARTLMEKLIDVRFLVLHDFDQAGFAIAGTLTRDTWRHKFTRELDVVDLGLRLADVQSEKLEGEPVRLRGESPAENLTLNGATEEEIAYLTSEGTGRGQRVELNAMTSPQFIAWLERKLKQHRVTKFIPDKSVLAKAYRRSWTAWRVNARLQSIYDDTRSEADAISIPEDLEPRLKAMLRNNSKLSWDSAVADMLATEACGSAHRARHQTTDS